MMILTTIILSLCGVGLVGCVFFWIRNEWVYKVRVDMIWNDFETFETLPSYVDMVLRFWIWDVSKFLPKN